MCISGCMNQDCHERIYGENALEPGEIDEKREQMFEGCVRDVLRKELAQRRRSPAKEKD